MDSVQGYISHSGREGEGPGNCPVGVSEYDQSETDRTQRRVSVDVVTKTKTRNSNRDGSPFPPPGVCIHICM